MTETPKTGNEPAHDLDETCEKCGKGMAVKSGRFGQFLACTGYPDCRNTRNIIVDGEGRITSKVDRKLEEKCPKCSEPLMVKQGRFGEYTACSGYPDCRYIKLEEVGVPCPEQECKGGQIVVRMSKRGRTFYGCDQYPGCDFVTWNRPLARTCPDCASPYTTEKVSKRWGKQVVCPDENCDFKETVEAP